MGMGLPEEFFNIGGNKGEDDGLSRSMPDSIKLPYYLGNDMRLRPFVHTWDLTIDVAMGTSGTIEHLPGGITAYQEEIFEVEKLSHAAHTGTQYSYIHKDVYSRTTSPYNQALGHYMVSGTGPIVTAYLYSWWEPNRLVRFARRMIVGQIVDNTKLLNMTGEFLDGLAYADTNGGARLREESKRGVFVVPCVEVYVPGLAIDKRGHNYQPFDDNNLIYRVQADPETGELDYERSIPEHMYRRLSSLRENTKPNKRFTGGLDF